MLCVGAYERDNVGDLLFLLATEPYLRHAEVTFAAPFEVDMTPLLDRRIPAFGPLLQEEDFDAVWTVGGEVGAVGADYAYRTRFGDEAHRELSRTGPEARRERLAEVMGPVPIDRPYLPRVSDFERNRGAAVVVHSAGVGGIAGQTAPRLATAVGILAEATRISVRDPRSSEVLTAHGIAHAHDPDIVHTIALTHPVSGNRGDYALIQVADLYLRRHGHEAVARALATSRALAPFELRMFLAGTAPQHDSVQSYRRIVELVRRHDPNRRITISTARRPWDRVDEIAGARLWLGGSLHGRIVAAAYGVPRATLRRRKPEVYARAWDPDMPLDLVPATFDRGVARALALGERGDDRVGRLLADRADRSARAAADHVLSWSARPVTAATAARLRQARRLERTVLQRLLVDGGADQQAVVAAGDGERVPVPGRLAAAAPGWARRLRRRTARA